MPIYRNATIVAMALFAVALNSSSVAQNAPVDLVGRVILPKGAAAMPTIVVFAATPKKNGGAMSTVYPDCAKQTHPDAMGDFKIPALDPTLKFKILITATGCKLQILDSFDPANGPFTSYLELADANLTANNLVRGRVTDLKGAPIPNAFVTVTGVRRGTSSSTGGTVRNGDFMAVTDLHGEFTLSSKDPYKGAVSTDLDAILLGSPRTAGNVTEVNVQVEARGFVRQKSTLIVGAVSPTQIGMQEGDGMIQGVVTLPNGGPAADADVAVKKGRKSLGLHNTRLSGYANDTVVTTDAAGHFAIPSDPDGTLLFAAHANGVGAIRLDEQGGLEGSVKISLQPWAVLQGQYKIGSHPGSNTLIQLNNSSANSDSLTLDRTQYAVMTDADGRFEFTNLPAGKYGILRETALPNGGRRGENIADVDLEPGHVNKITIGGNGRTLIGKIAAIPAGEIFDASMVQMRAIVNNRSYGLDLAPDNSFRAEDIPAGEARITISTMESDVNNPNGRRSIGNTNFRWMIPFLKQGQSNEPVDIGVIEVPIRRLPSQGRVAPDFTARTAESEELHLTDYRGKYVLLDLAAGVPGIETDAVEKVVRAFSNSNNFMAITLCVNGTPATVNNENLPWKLGFVTQLLTQYGVAYIGGGGFGSSGGGGSSGPNLPAIFLIAPDGKFIDVRLPPELIYGAVSNALKKE